MPPMRQLPMFTLSDTNSEGHGVGHGVGHTHTNMHRHIHTYASTHTYMDTQTRAMIIDQMFLRYASDILRLADITSIVNLSFNRP